MHHFNKRKNSILIEPIEKMINKILDLFGVQLVSINAKTHKELKELGKEMLNQDPRATAMPHLFQSLSRANRLSKSRI